MLSLGFDPADSVITLFPIDLNDCLSRGIIRARLVGLVFGPMNISDVYFQAWPRLHFLPTVWTGVGCRRPDHVGVTPVDVLG